jgi:glycerophosphoryl diester phosphodiesterase
MTNFPTYTPLAPKNGIIGHRGMSGLAPENTLASFDKALECGLNWVEFDVRLSKDYQLMCIHDSRIERTTNQIGLVREYTASELNKMDAGSWFDSAFSQQFVPSLQQVVDHLADSGIQMNIEIKTPNPPSTQRLIKLSKVLIKFLDSWPNTLPQPIISCFDWTVLNRIRVKNPEIPLGFLTNECSEQMITDISQIENCALHCNAKNLNADLIQLSVKNKVPLLTFTVNDHLIASDFLRKGVFGVFSDMPLMEQSGAQKQKAS